MKPVRSAANTVIEPLEARIAPATIHIGATGNAENFSDTEYHEQVNPDIEGQDVPRPEGLNLIDFVDTTHATDPLSLSLAATGGNTFFLRLKAGDKVFRFSNSDGYKDPTGPFINVKAGNVVALFTDLNHNNDFDEGELTGISLGKGASVEIAGNVYGDIASNLDEHGTKDTADDTISLTGLVSTKQGITNLKVGGGNVKGSVFSAGDIKGLNLAGDVQSILAGTAADGQSFDFFGGSLGGKGTFSVAPDAGVAGASITNLVVKDVIDRVQAGKGGAGGKGGSLIGVQVTADTDGFTLIAGDGGDGNSAVKKINGGAGGSVQNVVVNGLTDPSPSSPGGIQIRAGNGGAGLSTGVGGRGGDLLNVQIGFEQSVKGVIPSASLLSDAVTLLAGTGGVGKVGGAGGNATGINVRVRAPESNGAEILVQTGDGGSSLSPAGKAGAGGSAKNLDLRNQSAIFGTDILVQTGRGGSTVGDGTGAAGGSITNVTALSYDLQFIAGNGTDGKTGGAGGSITGVTLLSDETVRSHNLLFDAGKGGDGAGGNGGNAGNIANIKADVADLASFIVNDGVKGNGGNSAASSTKAGLKGGKGGSVSNILVSDTDSDALSEGVVTIRSGLGGDGEKGGGAGGGISGLDFASTDLSYVVTAGDGGDATVKGKGGAAGGIAKSQILTSGFVGGALVTGSVTSGKGGDGKGTNGGGGAGGLINVLRISADGDTSVVGGNGGSGETGATGGAAGAGGSLLAVGLFANLGSANMRAGDGGALGIKPGNGGSITGENVSADPNVDPITIIGVRAFTNINIVAGSGTHGGRGGNITGITYGSTATFLLPTPAGSILIAAGNGSAEAKVAGGGGSIDRLDGSVSSGQNQTTIITAGDGGEFAGGTKGGAGGSIRNASISRGGNTGVLFTVKAGDAGDSTGGSTGAAGGSILNLDVTNIDAATNFRSVAAGDGGAALKKGGAGGSVTGVMVQAHDIGARTGVAFGYDTQGGIFAGVGGATPLGGKAGVNGNVINVSADAIASIVAGRTATPQLVEKASQIRVNGDFTKLLYNLNSIFPGTGAFQIRFGPNAGDVTPLLPGNATVKEVQDALNAQPAIQQQGGVTVTSTRSLGYQIRWNAPGDQSDLIAIETVPADVTQEVQGNNTSGSSTETKRGQVDFTTIETRAGVLGLPLLETIPGQQALTSREVAAAVPLVSGESQLINISFLSAFPTGTFTLGFQGEVTGTLNANSTALDIQNALNSLNSIITAGRVSVNASGGGSFIITFVGDSDNDGQPDDTNNDGQTGDLFVPENPIIGTFVVPETQRLDLSPISSIGGSTFTLTYLGVTTAPIPATATAGDIQSALAPIVAPDSITVSAISPGIFDLTFGTNGQKASIQGMAQIPEIQTLTLGNFVTENPGSLTVFFGDQHTVPLAPTVTAAQLQAALEAIPTINPGGVTVVDAPNHGFTIKFTANGDQTAIIGVGTVQEHQQLDFSNIVNSPTTEYAVQLLSSATVSEQHRGTDVKLPTGTSFNGRIAPMIATTTNPGNNTNFETQEVDVPATFLNIPGAEFYLTYFDPVLNKTGRTPFLPVGATAIDVQTALRSIRADVTVTSVAPGQFSIAFGAGVVGVPPSPGNPPGPGMINEAQITGNVGVREVQTVMIDPIVATPGAKFTMTIQQGNAPADTTVPVAVPGAPTTAAALDAALDALPEFAPFGGVTVTEPIPNTFAIQVNDLGDIPQMTAAAGGTSFSEVQRLDLNPYAAVGNAVFNVSFGVDSSTVMVAGTATAADIQNAFNALPSIQALITNNTGAVSVTETSPGSHVFDITFNVFGNQPSVAATLGTDDAATPAPDFAFSARIPFSSTAAQIETALESVGLETVVVNNTAKPGVFDVVFDNLGDKPAINVKTFTHEQQKLDVYAVGNFTTIFDNQSQTIDLNPATPGINDLPEGATAAQVLQALLSIPSIQALQKVNPALDPLTVTANADSSYTIVFNNVDGDVAFLGADQFEHFTVKTVINGSAQAAEVQNITPIVKGEFLSVPFARASLVGAVVDINELDSNVFKFIHQGIVYSAAQRNFEIGDTPIDGILMAKTFDQATANFTPEARLTAAGFFDNDNLIS